MKKFYLLLFVCLIFASNISADSFEKIKEKMSQPGCWDIEFINIIESDIFETVDTIYGIAYLEQDGRFYVEINGDIYLYDREYNYTYSPENNQVIIEKGDEFWGQQVTFITKLGQLYNSEPLKENESYKLIRKIIDDEDDFPDSMTLTIDQNSLTFKEFDYFDLNEEFNRLIILKQEFNESCDETRFKPTFPEDTERVKL